MRCPSVAPRIPGGSKKEAVDSNCSSAADQLDDQNHQRNDQQNMDVPRNYVESNEADQPKYQQHQENRPKHVYFSLPQSLATLYFGAFALKWVAVPSKLSRWGFRCGSQSRESSALSASKPHCRWNRRQPLYRVPSQQRFSSWSRTARFVPRSSRLRILLLVP